MKGLILCAGKGTRIRPLTYSQPKTLLPVAGKPVLSYCIEQLIESGIRDIGIVIHPSQKDAMDRYREGCERRDEVSITYIEQVEPRGIADAVRVAEPFLERDPFLLLLGDNLIEESVTRLRKQLEEEKVAGAIMLAEVSEPREYGIAEIRGKRIVSLEEKPAAPKSNLAVIGAYAFHPEIWTAVNEIRPSPRGEYEITDVIQWLIDHAFDISYYVTKRHYSDVGTVSRWLEANRWKLDQETGGKNAIASDAQIDNCTFIPPVKIGKGCQLKHAVLGPYVTVSPQSKIENCRIKDSVVLEGSRLLSIPQMVEKSVFGRFVQVNGCFTQTQTGVFVLGDQSTVMFAGGEWR